MTRPKARTSVPAETRYGGAAGFTRTTALVVGLGLSFGFISVVFAIAWESFVSLPGGVVAKDYVTLGRRVSESGRFATVSTVDYATIRAAMAEMSWSYGDYYTTEVEILDSIGAKVTVSARDVSDNYLTLLGVDPALGRTASDGNVPAAVISARMWQRVFDSGEDVVGKLVTVGSTAAPIIGVTHGAFDGLFDQRTDFWLLHPSSPQSAPEGIATSILMFGVLPEGATPTALAMRLDGHRFPIPEHRNDRLEAVPGLAMHPDERRQTRQRLAWLGMVVALLLALAFVALVDYLAADHAVHEESHAIRLAIGATPADVFRESIGQHAGYVPAIALVSLLSFLYMSDVVLGMYPFASALGSLSFTASATGVVASTSLLVLAFAWSAWAVGRVVSRRSITASAAARGRQRARQAWRMLLFMTAASLLLTLSIGLQYVRDPASTLGFQNRDALMVGVLYPRGPTPEGSRRIRDALASESTVERAARAEMLPLLPETVLPKNRTTAKGHRALEGMFFYRNRVDPAFFAVLDVDLLSGSFLDAGRPNEMVMSRTAALLFHSDVDEVVGAAIEFAPEGALQHADVFTVTGVVEDIPYRGLSEPPEPVVYTALPDVDPSRRFQDFWLIRHRGAADDIIALLHGLGGGIDEVYGVGSPTGILDDEVDRRSIEAVLALAGTFAFALGLAGVANALARAVADQAGQIGIRCALGGTGGDETLRIVSGALVDLVLAGSVLSLLVVVGRNLAPTLLSVITLPLVLPVLGAMAAVCLAGSYASIRRLARSPSALLTRR